MEATPELVQAAIYRTAKEHLLPFVKLTFPRYQVTDVHKLVCIALEKFVQDCAAGLSPRLIIEMPPRIGKSELVSRRLPAWILGNHPDWYVGLVSYGADLAESLSRDCRRIVMSDLYSEIFTRYDTEEIEQVEIDKSSKAVHEWRIHPTKDVPQPGGMLALGIQGSLTGRGFNVLLIDDSIKNQEQGDSTAAKDRLWDFYTGTLYDRLEPGGGICIIQQRWAVDDLVGRLLGVPTIDEDGLENEHIDQWTTLTLPAKAEPGYPDPLGRAPGEYLNARYTTAQWARLEANYKKNNPRMWDAKFQQRPTSREGAIFRPYDWWRFEDDPEREGTIFMFADTSYGKTRKSDYSVIGVFRLEEKPRETYRLLDLYRGRVPFPELKRIAYDMYEKWQPRRFVIEDYGSGSSLIQEFRGPIAENTPITLSRRMRVTAWTPKKDQDKDARAHAAADVMARGSFAVPKSAPWLAEYVKDHLEFQGEGSIQHDDMIDVTSMALILMAVQEPATRTRMHMVPFRMTA